MHMQQEVEIETNNDTFFVVGDCFESFAKLEARVEKFENSRFVKFWKRVTRTIEATGKCGMNKFIKPELKYYEIKYCCIHGGQHFKSQGKGLRNSWQHMSLFLLAMMSCLLFNIHSYLTPIHSLCNRTFKKGCPAHISLRANDRGSAL